MHNETLNFSRLPWQHVFLGLGLAAPLLAAEPASSRHGEPTVSSLAAIKPAEKCLTDLRAFDSEMRKDGYWLGDSGYGYGYPMMDGPGYGYGYPMSGGLAPTATGYRDVRPGYEIRSLVAAANILARHGQQQSCEDVLATIRDTYKVYLADMHSGKMPMANVPSWQQQQIAAAQPVTRQGYLVPVRSVGRHRCAQPPERGSRQRR